MHGAGNDYVFVDGFQASLPDSCCRLAVAVSDRNFGVGADGLVAITPPDSADADARMQMWNADGSEGTMCGNAARCVALWMELNGRVAGQCRIQTVSRIVTTITQAIDQTDASGRFCVNLGASEIGGELEFVDSVVVPELRGAVQGLKFLTVSVGNPHAVVFVDQLSDRLVRHAGAAIEKHARFAEGTNVEWVRVLSSSSIEVRVWERGSGETLACGSGACAAAVAAIDQGFCESRAKIDVRMRGGNLQVERLEAGDVLLTGPAAVSFSGNLNLRG